VASTVGITTSFVDLRDGQILFLPQKIAILAQGADAVTYSLEKLQITSAVTAGNTYGFGSPIHAAAEQVFPANGDGVGTIEVTVYPLDQGYESTPSAATITPSGSQTANASYRARIGGVLSDPFVIAAGATVAAICTSATAAINATLGMPVIATDSATKVDLASKWNGENANDILVEIIGPSLGTVFTIVQPAGGAGNPTVDDALALIGDRWETLLINGLGLADSTALDAVQEFGEGRWGELVHQPCVSFVGSSATLAAIKAVTDTRTDDRVNAVLTAPGSPNLPIVIAARQVARIAAIANNNPARDYGSQRATGLVPGADSDQWDYPTRDAAVKAGVSTTRVKDGVVTLGNVVTMYRPVGEEPPAYRNVATIVKVSNAQYNTDLLFDNAEWDGAPLIPDDQPTVNPAARKGSGAKSEVAAMIDSLGENAIISDPKTAKKSISAGISPTNPNRLDVAYTIQVSGNAHIVSVDLKFGFFFGTAPVL
jgi:phage tail sheath gpL-like